jgi:hypothetical protein
MAKYMAFVDVLCDDGRNAVAQIEIGCGVGGVDRYSFDVHGLKLFRPSRGMTERKEDK